MARLDLNDEDLSILCLVKGDERYVFLYADSEQTATLQTLGKFASDPELSFNWQDAATLSKKVRELA